MQVCPLRCTLRAPVPLLLPPAGSLTHSGCSGMFAVTGSSCRKDPVGLSWLTLLQTHCVIRALALFKSCICWLVWNALFIHSSSHSFIS